MVPAGRRLSAWRPVGQLWRSAFLVDERFLDRGKARIHLHKNRAGLLILDRHFVLQGGVALANFKRVMEVLDDCGVEAGCAERMVSVAVTPVAMMTFRVPRDSLRNSSSCL
ncbi:hypothetical protein [Duganella sp. Root198D2]|uniref:hypothetical protein n=1 Tax=Duganella sp. Root198D2 TaxID=1736489 RepID=UPI00070A6886|nr:hypothetical protein [Duganella sp. Root198D2]KRB84108.1 hypothetical protein ASE26_08430 [Duganella sp. Root198D2]